MANKSGLPNGVIVGTSFPFYREIGQKRNLVYELVRNVIRCFLGSGVFDLPTPIVP